MLSARDALALVLVAGLMGSGGNLHAQPHEHPDATPARNWGVIKKLIDELGDPLWRPGDQRHLPPGFHPSIPRSLPDPEVIKPGDIELHPLDQHLAGSPSLAATLVWWIPEIAVWLPWIDWPAEHKELLREAYDLAKLGQSLPMTYPPPNLNELTDDDSPWTRIAYLDATYLFFSTVSWSLYAEVNNLLPWGLKGLTDAELRLLLDGRTYFSQYSGCKVFGKNKPGCAEDGLSVNQVHVIPPPPQWAWNFAKQNGLISQTRKGTLVRFGEWIHTKTKHITVTLKAGSQEAFFGYRGIVPAPLIIEVALPGQLIEMPGCHGTATFMKSVLMSMNIPVEYVDVAHAVPRFPTEDMALSHGDDFYTGFVRAHPPIPIDEVFIDFKTHELWFGPDISGVEELKNVARQPALLGVKYLSDSIVQKHCQDLDLGNDPMDSLVLDLLDHYFEADWLLEQELWVRLDKKVDEMGCPPYPD